ncbi:uncharacterized protein EI90DRAFT_3076125, partial [Cantharellus anzutake]|uniref:uncharacterized protein n=1 Tax=Cantharellus anzutake TaxID=1750568 RepID=UPI0019057DCB
MEAKLGTLPIEVGRFEMDETNRIDHKAEFLDPDIRNGIVTAAALSQDGRYIALGFGNGVIEVADIDHQHTVAHFRCDPPNVPAWIEFICGSRRIVTEDNEGNITIFSHGSPPVKVGTLPSGHHPPVTLVADNGSFIIRIPRNIDRSWYENLAILDVSNEPTIHPLPPPLPPRSASRALRPAMPSHCTLGLSPTGQYVVVHDENNISIWSTETHELIHCGESGFILPVSYNTYSLSHLIIETRTEIPLHLENDIPRVQSLVAGHDADRLWLELLFCELPSRLTQAADMCQSRYITVPDPNPYDPDPDPPFDPGSVRSPYIPRQRREAKTQTIWLNGRLELLLPPEYRPIILDKHQINGQVWYGDRILRNNGLYLPCASKDGTRFLVQGRMRAPIVVDI